MATGIALEQLLAARTSSSVFPGYVTLIQALPSTLGEYHSAPSTWEDTMPTTAPRTIVNYRVQLKKIQYKFVSFAVAIKERHLSTQ